MVRITKGALARPPLTNEELENLSAHDLARLKLSDDESARLRDINMARRQEAAERSNRLSVEEEPILADLRDIGLEANSVWDLSNARYEYSEAIPILFDHLFRPYSDRTREGIAYALAIKHPEVRRRWSALVNEYRKAPAGLGIIAPGDTKEYRLGAKSALAWALAVAVTKETLPDLIALARDRQNGESRILLLSALRKSRDPQAKQVIEELRNDPDLEKEIASWRRKYLVQRSRRVNAIKLAKTSL